MFSFLLFCTQVYCLIKKIFSLFHQKPFPLSHPTLLTAPISPSPNVALGGLRGGRLASWWTSRLHRSEVDLSLAQRGSRKDRSLSFSLSLSRWSFVGLWSLVVGYRVLLVCGRWWWGIGFCWFVVASGGAFVDFVVGLVGDG